MENPIIVRYRWSADDLIQGYRYYFRHMCRPIIRIGLNTIFAILLVTGGGACFILQGGDRIVSAACALAGVYWFFIRGYDVRWALRRQYAERPDRDLDIEWNITPDNILTRSRLEHSVFSWEMIVKILRTPSGIMFYFPGPVGYFVPHRGFANDADFEQVVELAKSKVREFCNVT